jgi:hypothetical protein
LTSIVYGGDKFVAVGDGGSVLTSIDGEQWVIGSSVTSKPLLDVEYGNGRYVATGGGGAILTSRDGLQWQAQVSPATATLRSIVYGNQIFIAVGDAGVSVASIDGTNWMRHVLVTTPQESLSSIAYGSGKFIASSSASVWLADLGAGIVDAPALGQDRQFMFSVIGAIGQVYRVQATTALGAGDWSEIGSLTNIQLSMPFTAPKEDQRPYTFYRVLRATDE